MKQYRTHLLVCAGTGCVSCGSFKIKEALEKEIQKRKLEDEVLVIATGCNGFCERGPILMVHPDGIFYQQLKVEDIPHLVEEHILKGRPVKKLMYVPPAEKLPVPKMKDIEFFKHQRLIVLRNRGRIDPEKIEEYIAFDGYEALGKALSAMTPEAIIEEITASGLRGRGGAGFPTGKKWLACRQAKGSPKYLVCNGDEGDPGAFMDRSVLEADPHAVLEGMIIGAKAVGAEKGFIYIRHEYPLALKRMDIAISPGPGQGTAGQRHPGHGIRFRRRGRPGRGRVRLRRGDGPPRLRGGPDRHAPSAAPLPRPEGSVGQTHGHQQRRDVGHGAQHHPPRGRVVRRAGNQDQQGDEDLLPGGQDQQHRPGRGPDGHHPPGHHLSASAAASPTGGSSRPSRSGGPVGRLHPRAS